jgi:two-component system, OmpR family, sensor histidine kinase VicK
MPSPRPTPSQENAQVIGDGRQTEANIIDIIYNARKFLNICGDSTLPKFILSETNRNGLEQAKRTGVRIRCITEITKDNLSYCKELMKFTEIRHLNKFVGNSIIGDKEYLAQSVGHVFTSNLTYSNENRMLEQQNSLFENLWNNATTQKKQTSTLELGVDLEEIKVLYDPNEIRTTYINLINSAKIEISLIIATPNALQRNYTGGIINLLITAAEKRNVNVNLIIPTYDKGTINDDFLRNEKIATNFKFKLKTIAPAIRETHMIKTTFLIIDRKSVFIIDVKDDSKDILTEAVGFATFHVSKSRTDSYSFIFDTLWRQADLHESLRDANKNLLGAYEKLKEHDAMEKEFIDLAAHELRTPSQSIIGYSELLKDSPKRNKKYEEAISRNAERLYSLVTNMLSVARIESQTMKLNKTFFDLNVKIQNVINDVVISPDKRDKVEIKFKPIGRINILADKEKIFQVFANLLNNAIKFTGHGTITITLEQNDKTDEGIITFKDSGMGINQEIIPHLFSKFKTKSEKGLGLGLFISKSIIEAHQGKLEAYNNVDSNGATFVVTLPLQG